MIKCITFGDTIQNSEAFDMDPLINKRAKYNVHSYVQVALNEVGKIECGGETPERKGYFIQQQLFQIAKTKCK
ncbi:aldehyde dehydrogenase family protein [Staphylococcus nepalensis]|nr:aldehyde dehydrogenase family protein [Staphylococcus nepalensis]